MQRACCLIEMLQAILSTVASVCVHLREAKNAESSFCAISTTDIHPRVTMAMIYALIWGYAACTGSQRPLQIQVSDILKAEFADIAYSWEECGQNACLCELLLDLSGPSFCEY